MEHVTPTSVISHEMFFVLDANDSDTVGSWGSAPVSSVVSADGDAPLVTGELGSSSEPPPASEIAKTTAPMTSRTSTTMNAIQPGLRRPDLRGPEPPRPPPAAARVAGARVAGA